jgi:hypothetical protein
VRSKRLTSSLWQFATLFLGLLGIARVGSAALLNITWDDTSDNENGFRIERRIGTSGSYQPLASVGSNVVTYTDLNLANSTTYCYRVFAFNSAGNSNYSNENCGTTPAANFRVTVNRSGTGSGTSRVRQPLSIVEMTARQLTSRIPSSLLLRWLPLVPSLPAGPEMPTAVMALSQLTRTSIVRQLSILPPRIP